MYHYRISKDDGSGLQKTKLYIFSLGAMMLVMVMVIAFWASSVNVGAVTVNNGTGAQASATLPAQTYNGKYFSFSYPGGYIMKQQDNNSSELESAMLIDDTTYPATISLSVSNLPVGGLTKDGDYIYRKAYTNLYTERNFELTNGDVAVIMVKDDGTEQTAFIVHNNYLTELSYSTSGTNDSITLDPQLDQALASFTWH